MQSADLKLKLTERMKPVPPPHLSKENLGIWYGWCCKGDREVAREAAAKGGIHIELVTIFLTLRKKIKPDEVTQWFQKEVFQWVDELLTRKQIFRACHILKNLNLDPEAELSKIFYTTPNKDLRDYIGKHLEKNEGLDEKLSTLWYLLELILKNNIVVLKYKLSEESIKCLDNQEDQWKNEIAAKLFLRTQDLKLQSFLSSESLWKQLISYNDIKLLNTWINIRFSNKENYDVSENLVQIFKILPITNEMLNQLNSKETSSNTKIVVLNEFSKFGVFSDFDQNNFLNILDRLNKSENVPNIYKILSKTTSNISLVNFLCLLHDYCMENKFFSVFNCCVENFDLEPILDIKSEFLDLIQEFRLLSKENFRCNLVSQNIFSVSKFISKDISEHFMDNYCVFFALIIFSESLNFFDCFQKKSLMIKGQEFFPVLENVINKLVLLKNLCKKYKKVPNNSLTYYDLLQRHLKLKIEDLFYFIFKNCDCPNFTTQKIVSQYGYSKNVNYTFYLRQGRPCISSAFYKINNNKTKVLKKTLKLAINNFDNPVIATSCIAFLEIIDSSDLIRVTLQAANILHETHDKNYIICLFSKLETDPYQILNLLESKIIQNSNFEKFNDETVFVEALKKYEIVYKFCNAYQLKLPTEFLKNCATQNMWLPFLIFAQIKNYPIETIKLCLQSLKSPNLLEHLMHSVIHEIQVDDQNILMKERDSRKYFLSRIGVRKNLEIQGMTDSLSQTSFGSGGSSTGSDFLEIDIMNTKATLLQTLIKCHNSTDPPRALLQASQLYRNPLLAVFATSYEPDSIIINWLTWLAVSTELYQTFTNFDTLALCSKSVATLLNDAMIKKYPKTLIQSFDIFIPECPLKHFLEFLQHCIDMNLEGTEAETKLQTFAELLNKSRRNSILTETDHELTYLNNKTWLENTALQLLCSMLQYNCKSLYQQICVLRLLGKLRVNLYFTVDFPSVEAVFKVLNLIFLANVKVRLDVGQMLGVNDRRKAIVDCINALLDNNRFDVAMEVAAVESLPVDLIVIKLWQFNFENKGVEEDFWDDCDLDMLKNGVTADCVIDFYLNCFEKVSAFEKYKLLKLAHKWALNYDLSNHYEIEMRKWLAFVNLEHKFRVYEDLNVVSHHFLYKEMQEKLLSFKDCGESLSKEILNELDQILAEALNRGNFWLALKLEKLFGCRSSDLEILKLCFTLAEGILMPYQLNTQQRLLLTKGGNFRRLSHRRTFLSSRISSFSSASHPSPSNITDNVEVPLQDTLAVLHSLTEKLKNGTEMAHKIFMSYRISINIEIPYSVFVINKDYMKMLKDALEDDCMNKLEVIHDFIQVFQWTKEQIADFICEEIVQSASNHIKSRSETLTIWDINTNEDYHVILQLLQDNCSILGYKIYAYASALHGVQMTASLESKIKISELALVIELLIMAHNCFTADCNMEGISIILKKSQTVISNLLTLRSWKLIVRLLTGVARYTEMNYVFQILRENDQFEFLLRKGSRKDNALKVALLEYLKKYCPENRELYKIVALHFTLFSEVALLWEREAKSVIKNLIEISKMEMQNNKLNPESQPFVLLSNTESTKLCLSKAMENYTHATEFHLQGEKLAKAMNSAKQVELLALQISLLNEIPNNATCFCILNLISSQITSLVNNHMTFEQSFITIQAYNFQPDWTSILYEHCVIKHNLKYLNSYLNHLTLSETLVHDISRKFLNANINTPIELKCMKVIVSKLPSVHAKYRLASELGFTDLVEELLLSGQLSYLKDTVWKKGYKS